MSHLPFLFACPDEKLNEIIGEAIKRRGAASAIISSERKIIEYKGSLYQADNDANSLIEPSFSIEFINTDSFKLDIVGKLNKLKSAEDSMPLNNAAKDLISKLNLNNFEDTVIAVSLIAVGKPNELCTYILDSRPTGIAFLDKDLQAILMETYGFLIFQEQAMKIIQVATDCSLTEANETRKVLSKHRLEAIKNERKKFVLNALKKKIPLDVASNLFEIIVKIIPFTYCKAHAVAHANNIFEKQLRN